MLGEEYMEKEPTKTNVDRMWKFARTFAEKSGTSFHPTPEVTEVVVKGLALHQDELGKPLCPCNFYPDKVEEAKNRRWICACDEMQTYKYCHACYLSATMASPSQSTFPKTMRGDRSTGSSKTLHPTRVGRYGIKPDRQQQRKPRLRPSQSDEC
jgi:ferredoxin-thioredoxin reductase catalytic chain